MKKTKFMLLRNMIFLFLFALCGSSTIAQTMCPGGGWENEPIEDPDGCCILFDMLPSTVHLPWAYWFVVADGDTYNNSTYPDGNFEVCYDDPGMYNVVVTYVDAFGVTLCENDWTVFVDKGCREPIPCEDCVEIIDVSSTMVDDCNYDFEVSYDADPACGEIIIESITWDFDDMGVTGSGLTPGHTFSGDGTYAVTVTIEYTVDETKETCVQTSEIEVIVTGCDIPCEDCVDDIAINAYKVDDCEYNFDVTYDDEQGCGDITIGTITWNIDDMGATGTGTTFNHTFSGDNNYNVSVTIDYTVTETGESCTRTIGVPLLVSGCDEDILCEDCCTGLEFIADTDDGCTYDFELLWEFNPACGLISIDELSWDIIDEGVIGTGTTFSHTFSGNGTYTIIAMVEYEVLMTGENCMKEISFEVEVTDCEEDECSTCEDDDCISLDEIVILENTGCYYYFVLDYSKGDCGVYGETYEEWDFGDGSPIETTTFYEIGHTFPADGGPFEVCVTFHYTLDGEDRECTVSIVIPDCGGEHGGKMAEGPGSGIGSGNSGIISTTVPNPADEQVTITVLDPNNMSDADQLQLVIFDINGREVYNGNTILGSRKIIDVSHFESGLYIYEIRDGETVILKEKLLIK